MKATDKNNEKKRKIKKKPIDKSKKQQVVVVAQEIKFARLLSGNEKKTRDRVLRALKKWLVNCFEKNYEFKEDDFTRVWKGLFYAVWMSDKPLVQEDLCESIAGILDLFPPSHLRGALMMARAGFRVLATEWFGIDHHRIDKFLMLVRRYLRGALRCVKRCAWSDDACAQFSDMLAGKDGETHTQTHRRILSKCNETTMRLDEMSRGLRDASVNLQNVNNKFLALSNTQFVESRVYDDDADVTTVPLTPKEPPQLKDLTSELSKLKQSLQVLESYHEPLHILRDSDSDSDSEAGDDRLVLKPRDLYSDRPLPYIIGSQAWRNKWHAGLVVETSDSDSSVSRAEEAEQFSDSEEDGERGKGTEYQPDRKISAGSSSVSEAVSLTPERPSPSAVAAELARRLGGDAKVPESEPVYTEPDTVVRKLYKPQQPVATTIFPEEPPPLEESSSDDDIFAELHKTRPSARNDRVQNDLFDFTPKTNSLEEALFGRKEANQTANNKPAPFEDEETVENPQEREKEKEDNVKKPVGGISLFGTNQHAESIGAAILRRNRRKSSNSDESNTEEVTEVKDVKKVPEVKKERDIFDDLFAKSEKLNKKSTKIDVAPPKEEVKKKDAFSDLFDDIDDIFSTDIVNVQIKDTKKDEKSLFTDDDDLFAEISKVKKDTGKETAKVIEKSDLLDGVVAKVENKVIKDQNLTQNKVVKNVMKESKGLFDSDSDDGLFTNATKDNAKEKYNTKEKDNKTLNPVEHKITNDNIFGESDEGDDLFSKNISIIKKKGENKNISKKPDLSKNVLFDSDDELFTKNDKENKIQDEKGKKNILSKLADVSRKALFDSDDELFTTNRNDTETQEKKDKNHVSEAEAPSKNAVLDSGDELFTNNPKDTKTQEKENENHVNKALLDSDDELFRKNVKEPRTKELEIDKNDTFNKNEGVKIVNKLKKPETESFDKNNLDDSAEDLFKSKEKSKAFKVIENINNDVFNDGDELFKKSETTNKSNMIDDHDSFDDTSISSKKSEKFEPEQLSSDIFNHPDVQSASILRTTRIASDKENMQTDKVKQVLDDDSDDELFKKLPESKLKESEISKSEMSRNLTEPVSQELSKTVKNDIFTDIFDDAPPLFEKPKEPKKSRNVNALFDDDSDDEALFFKKNDVITDEKPDFSPSEEKFGIFFDEPPAIDVDFTQKSNEISQKPKIKDSGHKVEEIDGIKSDLIEDFKTKSDNPEITTVKDTQDLTDNITKEPKKVGKLKPMNFNINVNTLLPGASPKKRQNENIGEQTASNEDLHATVKVEPKMVKSISFDDPEILDNKLSKERAKIQVKRRPSTRRARKEAVRKSAIDFTDSSFDSSNDSSVKDNVKDTVVKTVYILNDDDIFGKATEKNDMSDKESTKKQLNIVDSDEELFKKPEQKDEIDSKLTIDSESKNNVFKASVESKSFLESDDEDLFKNKIDKSMENKNENLVQNKNSFLDDDDDDDLFKQTTVKNRLTTVDKNLSQSSSITDDKSFSNTETKSNEVKKVAKSFLDSDDNDDLFTNKNTQKTMKSNISSDEDLFTNSKKGIETLGKVYETKNVPAKVENKTSIFDDFPPKQPENFKNINTKPEEVKEAAGVEKPALKSILDESSDEDDLFKTRTKLATQKDAKSLFGDDLGDGDDLFGTKTVKEQKQDVIIPPTSKEAIAAEPAFADPLSLFENDD